MLDILDSFEEELNQKKNDNVKEEERIRLYGEWADFDLDERKKKREKNKNKGFSIFKEFFLGHLKVSYAENIVNYVAMSKFFNSYAYNCSSEYKKKMEGKFRSFEDVKIGKTSILLYVNRNVRLIETILLRLDVSYQHETIVQEYLKYINFEELNENVENAFEDLTKEAEQIMGERYFSRMTAETPQLIGGGYGIGGMVKGIAVASIINMGVEKTQGMAENIRDKRALLRVKNMFQKKFEELNYFTYLADKVYEYCKQLFPFIIQILETEGMEDFFNIYMNGEWKEILQFSKYEYRNNLIGKNEYFDRLIYLLQEYPFEITIYKNIWVYDEKCLQELLTIAEYFEVDDCLLEWIDNQMYTEFQKYLHTKIEIISRDEIEGISKKYEEYWHVRKHYKMKEEQVQFFKEIEMFLFVDRLYCAERHNNSLYYEEMQKLTLTQKWEKVGKSYRDYPVDAHIEYYILNFYFEKASKAIEEGISDDFEEQLEELKVHFKNDDSYEDVFAKFIYSSLLFISALKSKNSEKLSLFKKDIEEAAKRGIISAKYIYTYTFEMREYKESHNSEKLDRVIKSYMICAANHYPLAASQLEMIFIDLASTTSYEIYQLLAERWKELSMKEREKSDLWNK